jgi:hypothetical protein
MYNMYLYNMHAIFRTTADYVKYSKEMIVYL